MPTVVELTEAYYHSHREWEPQDQAVSGQPLPPHSPVLACRRPTTRWSRRCAVEDYLANASLPPAGFKSNITPRQPAGRAWLEHHSAPADSLTTAQVEAFGVLWEDIDLARSNGNAWLTMRRSHRKISARWLDLDEDALEQIRERR